MAEYIYILHLAPAHARDLLQLISQALLESSCQHQNLQIALEKDIHIPSIMSLDGSYSVFSTMPGHADMNPCARECDYDTGFNGCDIARCWCNSGNLNLRMSSLGVCFSSSCTFSFMNTATDLTTLSYMQIEYCSKKGFTNLPGLSVPSTATPTVTSGAAATSEAAAASSAVVLTTAIVTS